jgi:hypothetical protein
MDKKKIFSGIGYAVILVLLIVIFINQKNTKVILFAFAVGLMIYGIIQILNKKIIGYILACLSVSLAVTGFLYFSKVLALPQAFTFMLSSSVAVLMALTLVFTVVKKLMIDKSFELKVEAQVIDLVSNPNTDNRYFQPYYLYEIDGEEYNVLFPGFINKNIPKIGDKRTIRVDKNDHLNVYFEKTPMEKISDIVLEVFFLIVSIVIMIGQFK